MNRSPTGHSAPAASYGTYTVLLLTVQCAHRHASMEPHRLARVNPSAARTSRARSHDWRVASRARLATAMAAGSWSIARSRRVQQHSRLYARGSLEMYSCHLEPRPLDASRSRCTASLSAGVIERVSPCVLNASRSCSSRSIDLALIRMSPGTRSTTASRSMSSVATMPRHPSATSRASHLTATTPRARAHRQKSASSSGPSKPPRVRRDIPAASPRARFRCAGPVRRFLRFSNS